MKRYIHALIVILMGAFPMLALGQGMILPHDHARPMAGSFAIKSISVEATVKDQVAQVQFSQVFRNTSSVQLEATYLFPVPHDGVIDQFTLMVDGKEMPAKLYRKEEARAIYESIVRSRKDPAILEYIGYGALQTQVFPIPPNAERQITLKYTQVCRRDGELTEFLFPLSTGKLMDKPVEELKLNLHIESTGEIKSIYSPSHTVDTVRPTEHTATVKLTERNVTSTEDLRLLWNLSKQPIGATLLSYRPDDKEEGYFLLLAAPDVKQSTTKPVAKTVIFALDKSGSMTGKKIDQAKGALKFVLNNLQQGDTFNIIDFSSQVQTYKPELQAFDNKSRDEALAYIDAIFAGGSTNIDGALKRAMELAGDTGRPTYLIFLTDGLPTTGEKNEAAIAQNAVAANKARVKVFTFGVGYDVNARLLDRLSTEGFGASEYVKPNDDIEASVAKFYSRMSMPILTNTKIELAGTDISRSYPKQVPDLFAGSQLLWVGRYKKAGDVNIKLSGKVGDQETTFEFPAKLADKGADETYAFVEKLWAVRRVGEIINELDLKGQNKELIDELVGLSTKHGILTPYTAFLADERTDLRAHAANAAKAGEAAGKGLAQLDGAAGVNQRMAKAEFQRAAAAPQAGQQSFRDADGRMQVARNCQVVGNQALFMRNNRWVDPTVTAEEEKKAEVIEQFSDKYFELARNNSAMRKFLAMPEGCTVRVQGQVYQINAQQGNKG